MADLFMVFHWSPPVTDPMRPSELMHWRTEAAARSEKKQ